MTSDWLAASSFEQTQELIAAITTLSIHAKLALTGQPNPAEPDEIEHARERLLGFLQRFQRVVQNAQLSRARTIIGVDPRFGELATRYLIHKERGLHRTPFFNISVDELEQLVQSQNAAELPRLIDCLQDLRLFVEHHANADITGLLGDA